MRRLEVREVLAYKLNQLAVGGRRARLQHDECVRRLAPRLMLDADDADFLHGGMTHQRPFDLDRRDVLTAADDHVLEPIANLDVAVRMHDRRVAAVEPAAAHRLLGRLRVVVVPLHHDVAAHADLAERLAIMRHFVAGLVKHTQVA